MNVKICIIMLIFCSQVQTQQMPQLISSEQRSEFFYGAVKFIVTEIKNLPSLVNGIFNLIRNAIDGTLYNLTGGGLLYNVLKNIPQNLIKGIGMTIELLAVTLVSIIQKNSGRLLEYLKDTFSDSISLFQLKFLYSLLKDVFWKLINNILNLLHHLSFGIYELVGGVLISLMKMLFDNTVDLFSVYSSLTQLPLMLSNFVVGIFGGLGDALYKTLSPVLNLLVDLVTGNIEGVFNNLLELPNSIGYLFGGIFNILLNLPNSLSYLLENLSGFLFARLANLGVDLGNHFVSFLTNSFTPLSAVFKSLLLFTQVFFRDVYRAIIGAIDKFQDVILAIPRLISKPLYYTFKTLWGLGNTLYSFTSQLVLNLIDHIPNLFQGDILSGFNILRAVFEQGYNLVFGLGMAIYNGIGGYLFYSLVHIVQILWYMISLEFLNMFDPLIEIAEGGIMLFADAYLFVLGKFRKGFYTFINSLESIARIANEFLDIGIYVQQLMGNIFNPILNINSN